MSDRGLFPYLTKETLAEPVESGADDLTSGAVSTDWPGDPARSPGFFRNVAKALAEFLVIALWFAALWVGLIIGWAAS